MGAVDIATFYRSHRKTGSRRPRLPSKGREATVFSCYHEAWLPYVDNLPIELHDNTPYGQTPEMFFKAIAGTNVKVSRPRGITVCRRSA